MGTTIVRRVALGPAGAALLMQLIGGSVQAQTLASLADLSLEELANITVTSVSRRPERLRDAPSSVFVITSDDIRRSGATTLPEALRLAPNLQVARIDTAQYAITARGFNNAVGNKLLVLIDGRTVYSPLFSGVFWDQQDVMLDDVERIEVISGPGATLWGANAVNGVINVITRTATDTQGTLVSAGLGNREQNAAFRYGGALGDAGHFRVYGKTAEFQNTRRQGGVANRDGRDWIQSGFRADLRGSGNTITVQGDAYQGRSEDRGSAGAIALRRIEVSGFNLLARLSRQLEDGSDFRVQAYVDHADRKDLVLLQPDTDIFDVEFQHGVPRGAHRFLWGGGYRYARDNVTQAILAGFRPAARKMHWANLFVQDEIHVTEALALTGGLKVEQNDYTGAEYLPSLRLAWKPSDDGLVWASASRAVRAPSRYDRDVFSPLFPSNGGPNFESEVARVLELGYRANLGSRLSYSATLFQHDWDKLRSGTGLPLTLENKIEGRVYGLEAWAAWQATPDWRLSGGLRRCGSTCG
jgi:iron complex outermembrane receptor protein